ncbi:MAG: extracellular solute-binding protein [Armatimonadetes bacterium]|nr:extracellular solute-binding protein [Armatimonadota bacterium]
MNTHASPTIELHGIAWGHVRGFGPAHATAAAFTAAHPGIHVAWEVRPLKDFAGYPVPLLCEQYDLVLFDHPSLGTCVEAGALLPLDEWLEPEYLADQAEHSVGPGYESYAWGGHQWGLAVDAAAQVAAYRDDLLRKAGAAVPRSWVDVFALAASLPAGRRLGLALRGADAICTFISISANIGGPTFWGQAHGIDAEVGDAAFHLLHRLAPALHPASFHEYDPGMLDLMARADEVVYAPLIFGYSNYARAGFAPRIIHFADIPSHDPRPHGSILGGVGLGISTRCAHPREAVAYAAYVASREVQCGPYFTSGGQPGHRAAWTDPGINAQCHNFFQGTLRTLDLAYLRPRSAGYERFQEEAGEIVRRCVIDGRGGRAAVRALNNLYRTLVGRTPT